MPKATINGVELFHDEAGSGETILFHHGYTGSHDSWNGVVERLQDRYRCIVMDCRGAGDSAHPADGYSIEQYTADVIGMADHLGLERFTFVGHSMGGAIGMRLGLDYAARLNKLVLVAPAAADSRQISAETLEHARELWFGHQREPLIEERLLTTARVPDEAAIRKAVDRLLSVSEGHFVESRKALQSLRIGERLGEITTPTLMVAGSADALLPYNLRDFERLGNASLHVFSRVSHGVPREVPAGLSRVLADFMEHGVVTAATLEARLEERTAVS